MNSGVVSAFEDFIDRLRAWAEAEPDVIGFVGMGSTADRRRVDEWSDHDFAIVTVPGAQERFRADLSWLPDHERLVAVGREHHDGFKALYDDGHILEFAVVDESELRTFSANASEVFWDGGQVGQWMREVTSATVPRIHTSGADAAAVFLVQLLVGVGRTRRGELLSGAHVIRAEAEATLIDLITERVPASAATRDNLDARRRFEQSYPREAHRIAAALAADPETAARTMLDLADDLLAPGWPEYPAAGSAAVRRRLGWPNRP